MRRGKEPDDPNKMLADAFQNAVVSMQAAWIEWRKGGDAGAAMAWIEGFLDGPGLLPEGKWDETAQTWYDANKADPFPECPCGRPSHIMKDGFGFCSDEHMKEWAKR